MPPGLNPILSARRIGRSGHLLYPPEPPFLEPGSRWEIGSENCRQPSHPHPPPSHPQPDGQIVTEAIPTGQPPSRSPGDPPDGRPRVRCRLSRRVRFACALEDSRPTETERASARDNAFAAWPSTDRLAVHGEFLIEVAGEAHPVTGYLISVADLDQAVRASLLPALQRAIAQRPSPPLPAVLSIGLREIEGMLAIEVLAAELHLGHYFGIRMELHDMTHCTLRQSFEFSAAHRLHCAELDDARNRELFGKCNNPQGHGHNYRLEVAVQVPLDGAMAASPGLPEIESVVRAAVIDRLDHRHLNEDIPHFAAASGGVNPSVENIAAHCRDLLAPEIARIGGSLRWLTLWETEKTGCTIEGSDATPDSR